MIILVDTIEELVQVTAGLVREGLTFRAAKVGAGGRWEITLLGGY